MFHEINLPLLLLAGFLAAASPGPATLAIAGTAMRDGRRQGLALASGIVTGSLVWSVTAACGLGAVMAAHAWAFEVVRYGGAAYLLFLAYKSGRNALAHDHATIPGALAARSLRRTWARGLMLHLSNPKAILFFGSIYAIAIPVDARPTTLLVVIAAFAIESFLIFHGYALLFSSMRISLLYMRLRRIFEGVFALGFGLAGLRVLTVRLI